MAIQHIVSRYVERDLKSFKYYIYQKVKQENLLFFLDTYIGHTPVIYCVLPTFVLHTTFHVFVKII